MNVNSEIIIYTTQDGLTKIDVKAENETVWLTQAQMAELFQTTPQNITLHIKNVYDEGELVRESTCKDCLQVQDEGGRNVSRRMKHYNLDVIISVGYRVKSLRGTQFRIWANSILKEYLDKGFAMNDDLLKKAGGGDYWKELLERIRDIRSSEKVFYRQVLELYATSVDYNAKAEESQLFFKVVQNKMHFAAHGHTASEIIASRASAELPFMGLTNFEGEQPRKNEIGIAKNYLSETEIQTLNRMVSAFFDLAELRAMQRTPMYMKDWVKELDDFAARYGKGVLSGAGTVSHQSALEKVTQEYEKYRKKTIDDPSRVERDYLESIKQAQKKLERKGGGD